ncbi:MAG: 16S rRNA (adenine(1518)-N(6)/adenine(1519)-N(6))-dimethyltransferase RsmA [Thermoplasmataceae archaeon]
MRNTNSSWQSSGRLYTRKYGQVFLRNPEIARHEAESLGLPPGSRILEIGPGRGILTRALLNNGYVVIGVESDHRWVSELQSSFQDEIAAGSLSIHRGNFLEFPPGGFDGIAGNIPYMISSKIIFRLRDFRFKAAVLMVQEEFAKRLTAKYGTKDYSRLTVNSNLFFDISVVRKVSKGSFYPVPGVDSAVVRIVPKETSIAIPDNFDTILSKLFSNRRKKIGTVFPGAPEAFRDMRVGDLPPLEILNLASQLGPVA